MASSRSVVASGRPCGGDPLSGDALDRLIHQRTRLQILTYLVRNRQAAFTTVRDELELTGGTLSKHADRLAEAGYVEKARVLTGDGFETRYRITGEGERAFRGYLDELRALLGDELVDQGDGGA